MRGAHHTVRWNPGRISLRTLRPLSLLCAWLAAAPAHALELVCPQLGAADAGPASTDERLVLTADQAEITEEGLSTLEGTVRLVQGSNRIEAQALSFDRQTQRVKLSAESVFRNEDLMIHSREAEFDLANETGTFRDTEFTLFPRSARGAAARVDLSRAGTVDIEDAYYTTCAPGSNAWFLEASEIELDRNEGLGVARHARLRFGYVPILYAPWFQFPIDDRRRTGLLFPTIGDSDNAGFDVRQPLYLNLAPNYDATLTPRYMSERGTQLGTEARYLFRQHTGTAQFEYLDEDQRTDERRSFFDYDHQGLINRRLAVAARYAEVSDSQYFEDLGTRLDAAAVTHLPRSVQLTYTAPAAYTMMARVTDYETVSATALAATQEPYRRLPEVRLDAITRKAKFDTRAGLVGQYANFQRELAPEGQRLDLNPFVRFHHDHSAWYAASQVDLRYTRYVVKNPDAEPTRTLPQYSVEGGLRFERITSAGQLQTLEPRLYYLYVPFREQSHLPLFDTGEPDFDFVQLFARNRFSGEDRLSDANHLALAFTSRLIDPDDGDQRFTGSLGQIFRFEAPQVQVPGFSAPDSGGTDLIGELGYRLFSGFTATTTAQWSQDRNELVRGGAALRYADGRRQAGLVYRYREHLPLTGTSLAGSGLEQLEQFDLSARSPVFGAVSAVGRWRYSRVDDRTLDSLGGLEYETCCWAVRGAWRRYQFNTQLEYTTGIYLQLELKGLTRIGAGFQSLLPRAED
jgi:LPS-assembly protein